MPSIPLHLSPHLYNGVTTSSSATTATITLPALANNPLPSLLRTPTGLALLEIQGTLNLPQSPPDEASTPVGRLVFPHYDPKDVMGSKAWMKTVWLYVGKHQRLTGEVKKLPKAVGVMRKRETGGGREMEGEELEMVEIVEWKVVFSSRPEPVGD